jgi:hypothetical protein
LGPNRVVERPKVIFNENTNQYVLWMVWMMVIRRGQELALMGVYSISTVRVMAKLR